MKKGIFISMEGPDGSGKSTQIKYIKKYFEEKGREVVLTREPGGTDIGEKIRQIILDRDNAEMTGLTEVLLYASSRAQHVSQVIKPALEAGKVVICDRYVDSSLAYQGYGRGLLEQVKIINGVACQDVMPDLTLFMDLAPGKSMKRIREGSQDRIESEKMEFHERVYRGYKEMAKNQPDRFVCVDATKTVGQIRREIAQWLDGLMR